MSLPSIEQLSMETDADQDAVMETDDSLSSDNTSEADNEDKSVVTNAIASFEDYLRYNSPVFQELQWLRAKGWETSGGNDFFARQRRMAANRKAEIVVKWNQTTRKMATEMQRATKAFTIMSQIEPQRILDLCMAPGTYLYTALGCNPKAHAVAFTLPPEQKGLIPMVSESEKVKINLLDITMLAADMGLAPDEVNPSHPNAAKFLHSRHLDDGRAFDLVICDGAVPRMPKHTDHRFQRHVRRLLLTQLALGLEHLRPGGTMIILLHKVERFHTIRLLLDFMNFANVVLFKHKSGNATLSTFYMIASNIRSADQEAVETVQEWKREWKILTLGTYKEWQHDRARVASFGELGIEGVLEEFGPTLVKMGKKVWRTQVEALKRAPFMKQ